MNSSHHVTRARLESISKILPELEEQQAARRCAAEESLANDTDSIEMREKTQDKAALEIGRDVEVGSMTEAEKEVPVILSNGKEVTEIVTEENNVASTSGVASAGGDRAAAVNVNDHRDSLPPLSQKLQELHIEESAFKVVVFAVAALSQVSIGASLGFPAILLLQLARSTTTFLNTELYFTRGDTDLANYLFLAGLVVVLVPSGWLVSTLGRRCSLVAAALASIASWVVHALAADVKILLLGRFLAGASAWFLKLSVTTYVMEVMVVTQRGRALACLEMMKIFGVIVNYGLNIFMAWYHVAFFNCAWMAVCLVAFLFFPESPSFSVMKQKDKAAGKALQRLRSSDSMVDAELQIIKSFSPLQRAMYTSLFKKPLISSTVIVVGLSLLSAFSGSPIILVQGAQMLLDAGFQWRLEAADVLVHVCLLIGCFLLFSVVDKISRRLCLLISLAILVMVNVALGAITYVMSHSTTNSTPDMSLVLARVCLILITAAAITLGTHIVPTILAAEYFQSYCRPQGLAMYFTISALLQTLILHLQPLIEETFGFAGLHWIFAIIAFLAIIYTNFCVHEIKYKIQTLSNTCQWLYRENIYEPRPLI